MARYQLEDVPLGRLATYAGAYKDRSSQIDIVPTDGILRKKKPDRNFPNALKEFFNLMMWKALNELHFGHFYNFDISSPRPIALDEGGAIYEFGDWHRGSSCHKWWRSFACIKRFE